MCDDKWMDISSIKYGPNYTIELNIITNKVRHKVNYGQKHCDNWINGYPQIPEDVILNKKK